MAIWLASVTSGVNFWFTFVGIYLVEKIGRRPLTLGSVVGRASTLLMIKTAIAYLHFRCIRLFAHSWRLIHSHLKRVTHVPIGGEQYLFSVQ